jgi:hypothetical protein
MSPSVLRSTLLAAAAGAALLTSCSSPSSTCTACDDPPMPNLPSPVKKERSVTVTPSKARPGARPIQYYIIEIKVPEKGGEDNFVTRHIRNMKKSGSPADAFVPSLHELSKIKGVDLMNVGTAREGQTLHSTFANSTPYPAEFFPDGKPLSYITKRTGLESTLHGKLEENGCIINIRGSLDCNELIGFTKYRLPAGAEVLQPRFNRHSAAFDPMRIPNGGFALFGAPFRTDTETIEDHRLGGLIRTKSTRTVNHYLAIGATTEPLGSLTAKTGTETAGPPVASGG